EIMAVVKANGYGHGAVAVAGAALDAGASRLGVASIEEAVVLRRGGVTAPVLVLGSTPPWEAETLVRMRITPTVASKRLALALARCASESGVLMPVHLKVDTGMNRYGLAPDDVEPFARFLQELPGLHIEGIFSHFASADETDKSFTHRQYRDFMAVAERLPEIPLRHIANSAGALDTPELALDMVRPGIALYGCYPSCEVGHEAPLTPAFTLKARVVRVHEVQEGETVSYGRTWTAPRRSRVAVVPCGYADGLPRALSNRGAMLVRERLAPILGRVCMDQTVVDVTDIPGVAVDDEVVIFGRQGSAAIPVEQLAEWSGTINYEILCGISLRAPRVYLRKGQPVQVQTLLGEHVVTPEYNRAGGR
ncbi:MAG: alanine racemase, partial [Chloroflexi bacterium]|nr:alanine racemase [Chloroflexota bacterium]